MVVCSVEHGIDASSNASDGDIGVRILSYCIRLNFFCPYGLLDRREDQEGGMKAWTQFS